MTAHTVDEIDPQVTHELHDQLIKMERSLRTARKKYVGSPGNASDESLARFRKYTKYVFADAGGTPSLGGSGPFKRFETVLIKIVDARICNLSDV